MSVSAYPTLRLKLTMPTALKLQFLPAVPGFNASQVANKVNRTGDTMSGQLFLAADPTFNLEAATKQYVDTHGSSGGGGTTTTISDAPPASPTAGSMWWESDTGTLWIFYNDGSTSQWVAVASGSGGVVATIGPPQGRLTLVSGAPVMPATVGQVGTVYYTPYVGDRLPLFDGTNFTMTVFTELSQATTDATKSPAACVANTVYDCFVWNDTGTVRCTRGPAWSTLTARGTGAGTTELVRQNGIWLNKFNITNGPSALRGTYVGSIWADGGALIQWTFGAVGSSPTPGVFSIWNLYNRVNVTSFLGETTTSYTYNSTTVRAANNNGNALFHFICGMAEDMFTGTTFCTVQAGSAGVAVTGVGYDSSSAFSGAFSSLVNGSGNIGTACGRFSTNALGKHFMINCEAIQSANIQTFYPTGLSNQAGMFFEGKF